MVSSSKRFRVVLLAMAFAPLDMVTVNAQSGAKDYGSSQASSFINRDSASRFTSSAIQQQLLNRSDLRSRFSNNTPPPRQAASVPVSKPFSSINRGPVVSPYLALNNSRSQVSDYFNIVRPQREQRRLNQQQQRVNQQLLRQNLANQHRLNQMAAAGPFDTKGSDRLSPTGHAAVHQQLGSYLNFGGYFPPPSRPKQQ